MKRFISLFLMFGLMACSNQTDQSSSIESSKEESESNATNTKPTKEEISSNNIKIEPPKDETEQTPEETESTRILVIYFSATGTTRPLAEDAADVLSADIYEIIPSDPYTDDDLAYYTDC